MAAPVLAGCASSLAPPTAAGISAEPLTAADARLASASEHKPIARLDASPAAPRTPLAIEQRLPQPTKLDPYLTMPDPPRCPEEMALVRGQVCIDRWEASLVELLDGGKERPWPPFQKVDDERTRRFRAISRAGLVPQGYISGAEAAQACEASGKRLCSTSEWVAACRGPADTTYPYGSTRRAHVCNDDSRPVHPVAEVHARLGLPHDRMWYEGMEHPLINQLDDTLRATGERSECSNELGVFDMVGNLHEWIDDPSGTFRGGFYMDTIVNGEGCEYETTAHSFTYHDYSTGFRCCLDADPVE